MALGETGDAGGCSSSIWCSAATELVGGSVRSRARCGERHRCQPFDDIAPDADGHVQVLTDF